MFDDLNKLEPSDIDLGVKSFSQRMKEVKNKMNIHGINGNMEADDELESDDGDGSARSLIQQESQGHGLYALGPKIFWYFRIIRKIKQLFGILDIIVYYPSEKAIPYKINDLYRYKGMPHLPFVYYELVDVHEEHGRNGEPDGALFPNIN